MAREHGPGGVQLLSALKSAFDPRGVLNPGKLGFDQIDPTERHVIIIVAIGERIVGLLVESVSEILGVDTDQVRETPQGAEDATTRAIQGIIPVGDDMTKIIDLSAVVTANNRMAA